MNAKFVPDLHHRRSIRLQGYDYAQFGLYFVTLCTHESECLLGTIRDDEMDLNDHGKIVAECWLWLGEQYPYVDLDEWVIMPNHLHGILVITEDRHRAEEEGGSRTAPTKGKRKSLGSLIGAFKTVSTKRVNAVRQMEGATLWQRNYYEHIVRNEKELNQIRQYIADNPLKWSLDKDNPSIESSSAIE